MTASKVLLPPNLSLNVKYPTDAKNRAKPLSLFCLPNVSLFAYFPRISINVLWVNPFECWKSCFRPFMPIEFRCSLWSRGSSIRTRWRSKTLPLRSRRNASDSIWISPNPWPISSPFIQFQSLLGLIQSFSSLTKRKKIRILRSIYELW